MKRPTIVYLYHLLVKVKSFEIPETKIIVRNKASPLGNLATC